jgi:hypothetical protein
MYVLLYFCNIEKKLSRIKILSSNSNVYDVNVNKNETRNK